MSSMRVVCSSDGVVPLSTLAAGARGVVMAVRGAQFGRADRLLSLGVTPGARVAVLQTYPAFVFLCDQTELAIERAVADAVFVKELERAS